MDYSLTFSYMSHRYLVVTGLVFTAIALLHAFRIVFGWTVVFAGWTVPVWFSGVGVIVAGFFAYWAWTEIQNFVR